MLSDKLREIRNSRNLTQVDVAKILKITREAYSMYESGKRQMNHESLCILADYYLVSVDYLLGRIDIDMESLAEEEKQLLFKYRALDDRGRENVNNIIVHEFSRVDND